MAAEPVTIRHRASPALRRLTKRLLAAPASLYDWHLGWLLGHRFLRLDHRGRRSGRTYHVVLEVVGHSPQGDPVALAAAGRRSQWYRNVLAHPHVMISTGTRSFRAVAEVLDLDQAATVLAGFERRHRILARVIRRTLSWLAGWPYDGSDQARRRLVEQLPPVAFPESTATDQTRGVPSVVPKQYPAG